MRIPRVGILPEQRWPEEDRASTKSLGTTSRARYEQFTLVRQLRKRSVKELANSGSPKVQAFQKGIAYQSPISSLVSNFICGALIAIQPPVEGDPFLGFEL